MINMLRKGIKFSIQRVYFPQSYFESRHYGKRFNSIGKFKSLTFQLRAIYFHTFAVDISVYVRYFVSNCNCKMFNKIFNISKGQTVVINASPFIVAGFASPVEKEFAKL